MTGGYGESRLMRWLRVLVCSSGPRMAVPASTMGRQPQGTTSNLYPLEATGVVLICTAGRAAPARQPAQRHPGFGTSSNVNRRDRGPWGTGAEGEGETPLIQAKDKEGCRR